MIKYNLTSDANTCYYEMLQVSLLCSKKIHNKPVVLIYVLFYTKFGSCSLLRYAITNSWQLRHKQVYGANLDPPGSKLQKEPKIFLLTHFIKCIIFTCWYGPWFYYILPAVHYKTLLPIRPRSHSGMAVVLGHSPSSSSFTYNANYAIIIDCSVY